MPRQNSKPPPIIPDHTVLSWIGAGSYGDVWLCRTLLGQFRAVKVVYRDSFATEGPFVHEFNGIKNFEPISRTHPGLVQILHVGANKTEGYFYYAMEMADNHNGTPLLNPEQYKPKTFESYLREKGRLPAPEALDLGSNLTKALAHLHRHELIHRDIKPANIIFVNGHPKLADIGSVTDPATAKTFVGTEGFVAPEGPYTPAADIYSLGKVLYEAATGKDRFAYPEPALNVPKEELPDLQELFEVLFRACDHNPSKRYATATLMANDLLLLQSGKSIKGFRKLERRLAASRRAVLTSVAIGVLAIGAFLYQRHSSQKLQRIVNESHDRLIRLNVSHGVERMNIDDHMASLIWFSKALEMDQNDKARAANDRIRIETLRRLCPKLVGMGMHQGAILDAEFSPDGNWIATASEDGTARIWNVTTSEPASPPLRHKRPIHRVVFSPDGRKVATASEDFTACVWDVRTGEPLFAPLLHEHEVPWVAFSPDGAELVTASFDRTARIWDSNTGTLLATLHHEGQIHRVAFSPDGKIIGTASDDGRARLWDAKTGQSLATPLRHRKEVNDIAFSADSKRVLTASDDGTVGVWDVETGRPKLSLFRHSGPVERASFSPDGFKILTSSSPSSTAGRAEVWDARTGDLISVVPSRESRIVSASFSPDGRSILLNADGAGRVWDAVTATALTPMLRHGSQVTIIALEAKGERLLTASKDGTWRIWDLTADAFVSQSVDLPHTVFHAEFDPKGEQILACERASREPVPGINLAYVLKTSAIENTNHFVIHQNAICNGTFSPDSLSFITFSTDGILCQWDAKTCHPISPIFRWGQGFCNGAFSPNGSLIAAADSNRNVRVTKVSDWEQNIPALPQDALVQVLTFSPDGTRIAAASYATDGSKGWVKLWNAETGKLLIPAIPHIGTIPAMHFTSNGRQLLTACNPRDQLPGYAAVWDADTGKNKFYLPHSDGVADAQFSPDNKCIVTASEDRTARIWDATTGKAVGQIMRHKRTVFQALFSPDGRQVLTGSHDGTVRLWDSKTGEPLTPPLVCGGMVWSATFSPDGTKIMAGSGDWDSTGQVHLWTIHESVYPLADILKLARVLSGADTDETGAVVPVNPSRLVAEWKELKGKYPKDFSVKNEAKFESHKKHAANALDRE
jgi:WD40 repeat protein/serine/threonine protein kinase